MAEILMSNPFKLENYCLEDVSALGAVHSSWVNIEAPCAEVAEPALYPKELKTKLFCSTDMVRVQNYENGRQGVCLDLIPAISDIKVIYDQGKNPKGVIVAFRDGTKQKAICDDVDMKDFNIWNALTICLFKCYLDQRVGNGSNVYHKLVAYAMDYMQKLEEAKVKAEESRKAAVEAEQELRRENAKKARDQREREIEIQKEAYLRAMREFEKEKGAAVD